MISNSSLVTAELFHNRRYNVELDDQPEQDMEDHEQAELHKSFIRFRNDLPELMFRARSIMS